MLAVARETARRERLAIDLCIGTLEDGLPFVGERFDMLVCALMLYHVPDLASAAHAFGRVLRPGGHLLITDFHPDSAAVGWRTVHVRGSTVYYLPNMPHTRADYLDAVTEAGFVLRHVLDLPVGDVPEGYLPEDVIRDHADQAFCLIVLAQKGKTAYP